MNSPLGKYSAPTAAILAIGVVGAYVLALLFGASINVAPESVARLQDVALVAIGAVFGAATAVNGYKSPLNAIHKRLDEAGIPPAKDGQP